VKSSTVTNTFPKTVDTKCRTVQTSWSWCGFDWTGKRFTLGHAREFPTGRGKVPVIFKHIACTCFSEV